MSGKPLKFLVIEDEEADFLLLERYLKRHFPDCECQNVSTREKLEEALKARSWDAVLSDYTVPGMSFRDNKDLVFVHSSDLPFILVSGSVGEEESVELIKQGVWDFVLKDNTIRLASAIKRGLQESEERIARRAAELKQRESANIIRNIIESSPDSVFVKDRSLRMVLCNKVLSRAVGKEPEELYGKSDIENGWSPEVVKGNPQKGIKGWEQDDLAVLGGEVIRASQEPSDFDGTIRYFDTVKVPLRDEGGEIIGVLGIGRDVTEQRRAEDERRRLQNSLEQERTLLLTLINSLPDMVYVKDRESRFILANRADAEFMGAGDPSGLVGKTDHDFYPADVAARFLADEREVIQDGRALVNHDEPNRSASGALRWILTTKVPYRDEKGTIVGLVGIGRDITDVKEASHKLREQAELLDISSDAIMVFDADGMILYWNKGAEKVYGWSREEALNANVKDLLFPAAHAGESEDSFRVVVDRGSWSGDFHQVSKDGRELVIEARLTLVRRDREKPTGILSVATDVTERRSIQSQLLRVQRLESLGTLAGGLAHDLNNVLSPILMGAEALALQHTDQDTRRVLDIIKTAAERGASIVHQVLGFARGVDGNRAHVQVAHVVKEISQIIRETFPKSIEIKTEAPNDLWPVMGDATQLHQVLMNLCVNARDAMADGGTLTLSARNAELDEAYARMNIEARPARYVVLKVEDTGTGMSPGTLEKVFDPFFSTKEPGKGTGLGLSTTRSIVKKHGGFIQMESALGRGSSFMVFIPAVQQAGADAIERVPEGLPMGEGELILIVDDETPVREITKQILESCGYATITAGDGTEALALYAEKQGVVRVVLTDMAMPYMDGAATIRALRKIDPRARIIATSGMAAAGQEREALSLGVDSFLAKPYTAETLLGALRDVLGRGDGS